MSNFDSQCSHSHIKFDMSNHCDSPCDHTHIKYYIP